VGNSPRQVMDAKDMAAALDRMAARIRERNRDPGEIVLVGVRAGGDHLAKRLSARLGEAMGAEIPAGALDISLYRDDKESVFGEVRSTEIPGGSVEGKVVVLVDDVLFTGRTVRSALDALMDYGRPRKVELAVLVDRGRRELPIQPDYVGITVETAPDDKVEVNLYEDGKEDSVTIEKNE